MLPNDRVRFEPMVDFVTDEVFLVLGREKRTLMRGDEEISAADIIGRLLTAAQELEAGNPYIAPEHFGGPR